MSKKSETEAMVFGYIVGAGAGMLSMWAYFKLQELIEKLDDRF